MNEGNSYNDETTVSEKLNSTSLRDRASEEVYELVEFSFTPFKCAIFGEGWHSWLSLILSQNMEVSIYSGCKDGAQLFFSHHLRGEMEAS